MISHKRFLVGGISDYLLEHTRPELIVRPSSILFELYPDPKNIPLGPQKVKNYFKTK